MVASWQGQPEQLACVGCTVAWLPRHIYIWLKNDGSQITRKQSINYSNNNNNHYHSCMAWCGNSILVIWCAKRKWYEPSSQWDLEVCKVSQTTNHNLLVFAPSVYHWKLAPQLIMCVLNGRCEPYSQWDLEVGKHHKPQYISIGSNCVPLKTPQNPLLLILCMSTR